MGLEQIAIYLLVAGAGWAARHYGFGLPATGAPQTRPESGGTVSPSPASSDLPSMIESIVDSVVKRAVERLESRLPLPQSPQTVPQTSATA